jgi:Polysaccharide deacetylase
MAFLASHHTSGHISGQCLSVDGGMEGRLVWPEAQATAPSSSPKSAYSTSSLALASKRKLHPPIRVLLTVDFDAISGYLGTGAHKDNNLADYSAGIFAGQVGAPRLLKLFQKLNIADKVTWFIPGHSMETFPKVVTDIVSSGAEIGLHGYCHEVRPSLFYRGLR